MRISLSAFGALMLLTFASTALAGDEMTSAQIQQKLQAEGYTDVHITGRSYGDVLVTATKDGKAEKLAVKPQSGEVMPAPDR
jgi:hypothetical protein